MTNLTNLANTNSPSHTLYLESLRAEADAERALQTTRRQHLQAVRQAAQTILGIIRTWVIGQPEFRRVTR